MVGFARPLELVQIRKDLDQVQKPVVVAPRTQPLVGECQQVHERDDHRHRL